MLFQILTKDIEFPLIPTLFEDKESPCYINGNLCMGNGPFMSHSMEFFIITRDGASSSQIAEWIYGKLKNYTITSFKIEHNEIDLSIASIKSGIEKGTLFPFDKLDKNTLWRSRVEQFYILSPHTPIDIYIVTSNGKPNKKQIQLYNKLVDEQMTLKENIFQSMLSFYREGDVGNKLPNKNCHSVIETGIEDIKSLVTLAEIIINKIEPTQNEILLLFNCAWEARYKLAVQLKNWNVINVGFQNNSI